MGPAAAIRAPRRTVVAVVLGLVAAALALSWPGGAAAAPLPWCGNDVAAGDRFPDLVAGAQIHVIYAVPTDSGNRLEDLAPAIVGDVAAIDAWWRREDSTRAPRFDVFDFPGCDSAFGRLDISFARLPRPSSAYDQTTIAATSGAIYDDLRASPSLRNQHALKKYIVLYDGPTRRLEDACAVAFSEPISTAFMYLQPPLDGCPPIDTGAGAFTAMVTAHELVHTLGGTGKTPGAPHACKGGHVCDAEADIIYGNPVFRPLNERVLDAGHDDYYAHNQPWFDVQDSPFLVHVGAPRYTLAVESAGGGVVAADLPGLYCSTSCTATFDAGTEVRLYGNPAAGKKLSSWSGACTGTAACRVTMSGDRSVKASFATGAATPAPGGTARRNQIPVAQIASPGRFTFEARQMVSLTSRAYDRDGRIVSQAWDWGDGTRAEGQVSSHAYAKDGRYLVSLTVTDDKDAKSVRRMTITVRTQPPRAMALFAFAQRGHRVDLRYIAYDNSGLARIRVTLTRGKKRLLSRTVRVAGLRSMTSSVRWKARGGDATFCVRAWDTVGNASTRECSDVRVH